MSTSAYNLGNDKLIYDFRAACAQAAVAAHPASKNLDRVGPMFETNYLQGVLLARLEGVCPPFAEGEKVCFKTIPSEVRKIERVFYCGGGLWNVYFEDDGQPYNVETLKGAPAVETSST